MSLEEKKFSDFEEEIRILCEETPGEKKIEIISSSLDEIPSKLFVEYKFKIPIQHDIL